MQLPLLVTPDKKRKTESICESSGIKLCLSQELHVNQLLSVCATVCVFVYIFITYTSEHPRKHADLIPQWGREDPNTVVFI